MAPLTHCCMCLVIGIVSLCVCIDIADPSGRAVSGVSLGPLACWDCGFFESRQGRGCLSVVSCQAEVSATGRTLVQRSPTECVCVMEWIRVYTMYDMSRKLTVILITVW
jgi:hypothetical protein